MRLGSATGSCQSRAIPSEPAETSIGFPGTYASPRTASAGVSIRPSGVKSPFHSRIVWDLSPAAICAPSCRQATLETSLAKPSSSSMDALLARSQIRTDLPAATAASFPSGLTARAATAAACPVRVLAGPPPGMSQTLAELSRLAEASCRPSGEKATARTSLECPSRLLGIPGEYSRHDSSFLSYPPPLWFRIRELVPGRG